MQSYVMCAVIGNSRRLDSGEMALDSLAEEIRPKRMIRDQPSKQMGKNVPERRSRKCDGSEVIMLMMIQ